MMRNVMWFGLALTLVGLVTAPAVRAEEGNNKTIHMLKSAPIVAVTPDQTKVAVAAPLMLLMGFGSIGIAFGLTMWIRRAVIREV